MSGFLLDTNVVSEVRKLDRCNRGVRRWIDAVEPQGLFLSVISIAEIRRGIALIRARDTVQAQSLDLWRIDLEDEYDRHGHLLLVTREIANTWGELQSIRPVATLDCFLAATAKVHNLRLVTRNVADFDGLGIHLLNPFA